MPDWHCIGANSVRTEPPIVAVHRNFFCSDVVRVVSVRQFVHFTTELFRTTAVEHIHAKFLVANEPFVQYTRTFFSCISS